MGLGQDVISDLLFSTVINKNRLEQGSGKGYNEEHAVTVMETEMETVNGGNEAADWSTAYARDITLLAMAKPWYCYRYA